MLEPTTSEAIEEGEGAELLLGAGVRVEVEEAVVEGVGLPVRDPLKVAQEVGEVVRDRELPGEDVVVGVAVELRVNKGEGDIVALGEVDLLFKGLEDPVPLDELVPQTVEDNEEVREGDEVVEGLEVGNEVWEEDTVREELQLGLREGTGLAVADGLTVLPVSTLPRSVKTRSKKWQRIM